MTKNDETNSNETHDNAPQFDVNIVAHYIKDLSFENPHHLENIKHQGDAPEVDRDIQIGTEQKEEGLYEVSLKINLSAKAKERNFFMLELVYAGLFQIKKMDEAMLPAFLMVEAPRIMYPSIRKVISEITFEGGLPPFYLNPIDFNAMFMENMKKMEEEAKGQA